MLFKPLAIAGCYFIESGSHVDDRGSFSRVFCAREFKERGLVANFDQHSVSRSVRRGTLRGLHFQAPPFEETKVVRCVSGVMFDVVADLRADSPSFGQWCGIDLHARSCDAIYVPSGCAHGFQTLVDHCEVEYLITPEYRAAGARGIRWDDPTLNIRWPLPVDVMSERDRNFPAFDWSRGLP